MARIVADRVQETSTTTGAGAYTLAGATVGFRAASTVCVNGDTFTYHAEDVDLYGRQIGGWETGLGTWGSGNILTRTTIYSSSNGNAAVSWGGGQRRIAMSLLSQASLGPTTVNGNLTAANFSGSSSGTNTGDQSAADILTAIKTVDGAGSGLDADLLDGLDSSVYLKNNQAVTTVGSGITGQVWLDIANSGIGNQSGFRFIKASDSAGIAVTETTSDQTLYEFYMSDNPDGGDNFSWRFTDWQGSNGLWQPLQLGGMTSQYSARYHNFYGSIIQPTAGGKYFTTSNIGGVSNLALTQVVNDNSKLKTSGSGSVTITSLNVSGYTGSTGQVFTIKLTSETTFDWGYGNSSFTPVQSGLIVTTTPQTLSNGISVTFSSTTGGAINDIFQCRVFQAPANSFGSTVISSLALSNSLPITSGGTGNVSGLATGIINTGTVTLATATESNSITVTQPSYSFNTPVKLLNFNWYTDTWSLGNIRSSATPSNGLGIFLNSVEQYRFTSTGLAAPGLSAPVLTSTVANGTSPFVVTSSTKVNNLNADLLDGMQSDTLATSSTIVARDASGNFSANAISAASGFTGNLFGTSSNSNRLTTTDTRSTNPTPQSYTIGITSDFKQNTSDSLSDGGTFHGVISFKQWTDWSGGGVRQLAFTDNHNLWLRGANADTNWSNWRKLVFSDSPTFSGQITSTATNGTAPLIISSTTKVNNLNADLLDDLNSTSFARADSTFISGHHPEGRVIANAFLANDLANARLRGSTFTFTNINPTNTQIDYMFDGLATQYNFAVGGVTFPVVIEFTLPRVLQYSAYIGIGFGNASWRCNSVLIETFTEGAWQTTFNTTTNTSEDIYTSIPNNGAIGTTKVRYTLSNPNSTNIRICHLWGYNFNSDLWSQTMFPRSGGTVYGSVTANSFIGATSASTATFTPVGTIAATNVQAAITEIDADRYTKTEVDALILALRTEIMNKFAAGYNSN